MTAFFRIYAMAALVFAMDQASKYAVLFGMDLLEKLYIPVYPPFLTFVMAWNQGMNFGLFSSDADMGRYVLIGIAVFVCAALTVWGMRQKGWLVPLCIGAVIGGALGNVYDRIIYGAVADFLNMSCCGIQNPFAFNVADIGIFIGAVCLVLFSSQEKDQA